MRKGDGRRTSRWCAALLVTLLVVSFAPAGAAARPLHFSVVYSVEPAAAAVQVALTIDEVTAGSMRLNVHENATAVRASIDGEAMPVSLGEADELERTVAIDVRRAGGPMLVEYELPSAPARSAAFTRVNRAYVSFLAIVDSDLGNGSVRVELPPGFVGGLDRSVFDLEARTSSGEVWVRDAVGAAALFDLVVARNEAGLARSTVDVGGRSITIAGWEDDPEWIAHAENTVRWGVPLMADLTGQPWPENDLEVLESTVPAEFGYGGWFSVWQSEIEVGDQLDESLMLHELAHAWFHDERLDDRWVYEGWAEDFSNLALSMQTGEEISPPLPDMDAPGVTELAQWGPSDEPDAISNRYDTSWYVLHTLREEIGLEATAQVLAAIFEGRSSYGVDGDPAVFPATGSARLLDLFENVGGSELAGPMFRTYVFPESTIRALDQRDQSRSAYEELLAIGDYTAPPAVRDRLAKWKFAEADLLIAEALPVAQRLAALEVRAEALDAAAPVQLIADYEAGAGMGTLGADLDRAEAALDAIEAIDDDDERQVRLARFSAGVFTSPGESPTLGDGTSTTTYVVGGAVLALVVFGGFAALAFRAARQSDW